MTYDPPGSLPYHPKEMGATSYTSPDVGVHYGIFGALGILGCAVVSLILFVLLGPLVALGVMEIVWSGPTNYRVRWTRKDS